MSFQKSLYGFKQALRCWFTKLSHALKQSGFKQSYSDYSLFTYSARNIFCILVYTDDLIIAGNDLNALQRYKEHLSTCVSKVFSWY